MVLALLVTFAVARAHGTFHGTVLAVEASKGEAVVARSASKTEPGVTATYRIDPTQIGSLRPGDVIAATEDESTTPVTLDDVMIRARGTALTGGLASPVREVKQLAIGDEVPTTTLLDQDGRPFTLARYAGRDLIVGFIYTRCRDARECPLTTAKFGQMQAMFTKRDVALLEVTLDPQFDTPPVLERYARSYGANPARWTFATGAPNDVLNFDAAFGLNPFADPSVGLIHSETLAMIDKTGTIRDLIYTNAWSPNEIASELDSVDGVASNPFQRFDLRLKRAAVAVCGDSVAGFDGIVDLAVVLAIFAATGYLLWRLARAFAVGASR